MRYKLSSEDMLFIGVPAILGIFFAFVIFYAVVKEDKPQEYIVKYQRIDCKK